jgi:hypothetical protein
VTVQVKSETGQTIATLTTAQEAAFRHMKKVDDARMNARVLKSAMTRLANEQKDFGRWDRGYQTERRRRIRKVQKLEATIMRLTGIGRPNGEAG